MALKGCLVKGEFASLCAKLFESGDLITYVKQGGRDSKIVRLGPTHVRDHFTTIAKLHTSQIQHGILPKLGIEVLTQLYYELSAAPKAGVWAAIREGKVVGFVAGCANIAQSCQWVLSKPRFLFCLIPAVARAWRLGFVKLISPVTYLSRAKDTTLSEEDRVGGAELLAISIAPEARSQGLGRDLVGALEKEFEKWGGIRSYRVSTNVADPDSNRFYLALGFVPLGRVRHHDLVLQVYQKHVTETPAFHSGSGGGSKV